MCSLQAALHRNDQLFSDHKLRRSVNAECVRQSNEGRASARVCVYVIQMDCDSLKHRRYSPLVIIDHLPEIVYLSLCAHSFHINFMCLSIISWYEYDTFAGATATAAAVVADAVQQTTRAQNSVRCGTIKVVFAHGHIWSWSVPQWTLLACVSVSVLWVHAIEAA